MENLGSAVSMTEILNTLEYTTEELTTTQTGQGR